MNTAQRRAVEAVLATEPPAVAFDGCHKIYIAQDEAQVALFEDYGYEHVVRGTPSELMANLDDWYESSCGLRFISAVATNPDGPDEFTSVIRQFEDEE